MGDEKDIEMKEDVKEFLEMNRKQIVCEMSGGNKIVHIDFDEFSAHSPELAENLIERPEEMIQLLEIGLEELEWAPNDARARFMSIAKGQELFIRNIRSKHLGKMISIEGIVRQASEVRPLIDNAKFECPGCGTIISALQIDKKFKEPSRCSCGRRGGFKELSKDMIDAQDIIIEESSRNMSGEEQLRSISITLRGDLTEPLLENKTSPGKRIKVIGVLEPLNRTSFHDGVSNLIEYNLVANNLIPIDNPFGDMQINEEEMEQITIISKDPNALDKIVEIIPTLVNVDNVIGKAIVLQLFGGIAKIKSDESKARKEIHILLIERHSQEMDRVLRQISKIHPKSRYVDNTPLNNRPLVSQEKNRFLKAGEMTMANDGVLCINKINRKINSKGIKDELELLKDAMENQEIKKSDERITIKHNASVLATATIEGGTYQDIKYIKRQVGLTTSLYERFDCIFIIDNSSEGKDMLAINNILPSKECSSISSSLGFIKKYIYYVENYYREREGYLILTEEAREVIAQFYPDIRNPSDMISLGNPVEMSARGIESAIRLAEANAKLHLRDEVTEEDAEVAIDILKVAHGFNDLDKVNTFDIDIIKGNPALNRNKIHVVQDIVNELEKKYGRNIPLKEIMRMVKGKLSKKELAEVIKKLLKNGELFRPKRGFVQRM